MSGPGPAETVERALERARSLGAGDAVVVVEETSSTNLRWAANQLTTNGVTAGRSVGVVAVHDGATGRSVGGATRQVATVEELDELVDAAVARSRAAAPAADAAALPEGGGQPGFDDAGDTTSPEVLRELAGGLGELFGHAAASEAEMFGFAEHTVTTTWLGTGAGVRRRTVEPYGTVELNGRSTDRERSAWSGAGTRDFSDVDLAGLEAEVHQGLTWQQRRVDVAPGRHEVVLPPSAVADLYAYWLLSADARTAHEGRGVFARPGGGTRVGEQLTDLPITVRDDPYDALLGLSDVVAVTSSSETASVFDAGLPVPGTRYLDAGRLTALPSSRHTARLAGVPVAPPAGNVLVEVAGGVGSTADLVRGTASGLLLTCLWYVRVVDEQTMLLTGLTRDGVYVVQGGEVVGATSNFRFNDSPAALLRRVQVAGESVRCLPREFGDSLPRTQAPALRVADFHLSSVSLAS